MALAFASTLSFTAQPPQFEPSHPSSFADLFNSTGFVGPLLLLAGLVALAIAIRRWIELRPARLAPLALQRELEAQIHGRELAPALERAKSSRTVLGELVAAGLYLRKAGLDEMLANVERTSAKEAQRLGSRVANLARLGGVAFLIGLFGTTMGLINSGLVILTLKDPLLRDFILGIGESLMCTALGLFVALFCFIAFFWFDAKLTPRMLAVRDIAEDAMRDAAEKGGAPPP